MLSSVNSQLHENGVISSMSLEIRIILGYNEEQSCPVTFPATYTRVIRVLRVQMASGEREWARVGPPTGHACACAPARSPSALRGGGSEFRAACACACMDSV